MVDRIATVVRGSKESLDREPLVYLYISPTSPMRLSEFVENKNELVSESGIKQRTDVERLMAVGVNSVLIGETLMRSDDISATFAQLFNTGTDRGD